MTKKKRKKMTKMKETADLYLMVFREVMTFSNLKVNEISFIVFLLLLPWLCNTFEFL